MAEPRARFTFTYRKYEKGVFGKCNEMPAVSAQAKTLNELNSLLNNMIHNYLKVVKKIGPKK